MKYGWEHMERSKPERRWERARGEQLMAVTLGSLNQQQAALATVRHWHQQPP